MGYCLRVIVQINKIAKDRVRKRKFFSQGVGEGGKSMQETEELLEVETQG